jgi:hypothetical protein
MPIARTRFYRTTIGSHATGCGNRAHFTNFSVVILYSKEQKY